MTHKFNVQTQSPEVSKDVPVKRIFIKQQIDQLVAEHWLNENPKVVKQLVDLSINENMPTPYSQMVAFEVTPEQKKNFDADKNSTNGKGWSGKKIAAAGAGVIVVGTGVFMLGNVAATAAGGSSVLDGFGDIFSGGGGGDCDCCGDFGDCCDGIGDAFGDCCEGIGDCCGDIGDCFGDCFG